MANCIMKNSFISLYSMVSDINLQESILTNEMNNCKLINVTIEVSTPRIIKIMKETGLIVTEINNSEIHGLFVNMKSNILAENGFGGLFHSANKITITNSFLNMNSISIQNNFYGLIKDVTDTINIYNSYIKINQITGNLIIFNGFVGTAKYINIYSCWCEYYFDIRRANNFNGVTGGEYSEIRNSYFKFLGNALVSSFYVISKSSFIYNSYANISGLSLINPINDNIDGLLYITANNNNYNIQANILFKTDINSLNKSLDCYDIKNDNLIYKGMDESKGLKILNNTFSSNKLIITNKYGQYMKYTWDMKLNLYIFNYSSAENVESYKIEGNCYKYSDEITLYNNVTENKEYTLELYSDDRCSNYLDDYTFYVENKIYGNIRDKFSGAKNITLDNEITIDDTFHPFEISSQFGNLLFTSITGNMSNTMINIVGSRINVFPFCKNNMFYHIYFNISTNLINSNDALFGSIENCDFFDIHIIMKDVDISVSDFKGFFSPSIKNSNIFHVGIEFNSINLIDSDGSLFSQNILENNLINGIYLKGNEIYSMTTSLLFSSIYTEKISYCFIDVMKIMYYFNIINNVNNLCVDHSFIFINEISLNSDSIFNVQGDLSLDYFWLKINSGNFKLNGANIKNSYFIVNSNFANEYDLENSYVNLNGEMKYFIDDDNNDITYYNLTGYYNDTNVIYNIEMPYYNGSMIIDPNNIFYSVGMIIGQRIQYNNDPIHIKDNIPLFPIDINDDNNYFIEFFLSGWNDSININIYLRIYEDCEDKEYIEDCEDKTLVENHNIEKKGNISLNLNNIVIKEYVTGDIIIYVNSKEYKYIPIKLYNSSYIDTIAYNVNIAKEFKEYELIYSVPFVDIMDCYIDDSFFNWNDHYKGEYVMDYSPNHYGKYIIEMLRENYSTPNEINLTCSINAHYPNNEKFELDEFKLENFKISIDVTDDSTRHYLTCQNNEEGGPSDQIYTIVNISTSTTPYANITFKSKDEKFHIYLNNIYPNNIYSVNITLNDTYTTPSKKEFNITLVIESDDVNYNGQSINFTARLSNIKKDIKSDCKYTDNYKKDEYECRILFNGIDCTEDRSHNNCPEGDCVIIYNNVEMSCYDTLIINNNNDRRITFNINSNDERYKDTSCSNELEFFNNPYPKFNIPESLTITNRSNYTYQIRISDNINGACVKFEIQNDHFNIYPENEYSNNNITNNITISAKTYNDGEYNVINSLTFCDCNDCNCDNDCSTINKNLTVNIIMEENCPGLEIYDINNKDNIDHIYYTNEILNLTYSNYELDNPSFKWDNINDNQYNNEKENYVINCKNLKPDKYKVILNVNTNGKICKKEFVFSVLKKEYNCHINCPDNSNNITVECDDSDNNYQYRFGYYLPDEKDYHYLQSYYSNNNIYNNILPIGHFSIIVLLKDGDNEFEITSKCYNEKRCRIEEKCDEKNLLCITFNEDDNALNILDTCENDTGSIELQSHALVKSITEKNIELAKSIIKKKIDALSKNEDKSEYAIKEYTKASIIIYNYKEPETKKLLNNENEKENEVIELFHNISVLHNNLDNPEPLIIESDEISVGYMKVDDKYKLERNVGTGGLYIPKNVIEKQKEKEIIIINWNNCSEENESCKLYIDFGSIKDSIYNEFDNNEIIYASKKVNNVIGISCSDLSNDKISFIVVGIIKEKEESYDIICVGKIKKLLLKENEVINNVNSVNSVFHEEWKYIFSGDYLFVIIVTLSIILISLLLLIYFSYVDHKEKDRLDDFKSYTFIKFGYFVDDEERELGYNKPFSEQIEYNIRHNHSWLSPGLTTVRELTKMNRFQRTVILICEIITCEAITAIYYGTSSEYTGRLSYTAISTALLLIPVIILFPYLYIYANTFFSYKIKKNPAGLSATIKKVLSYKKQNKRNRLFSIQFNIIILNIIFDVINTIFFIAFMIISPQGYLSVFLGIVYILLLLQSIACYYTVQNQNKCQIMTLILVNLLIFILYIVLITFYLLLQYNPDTIMYDVWKSFSNVNGINGVLEYMQDNMNCCGYNSYSDYNLTDCSDKSILGYQKELYDGCKEILHNKLSDWSVFYTIYFVLCGLLILIKVIYLCKNYLNKTDHVIPEFSPVLEDDDDKELSTISVMKMICFLKFRIFKVRVKRKKEYIGII